MEVERYAELLAAFEALKDRAENTDPYELSSLKKWFTFDLWETKEALCLVCNIDPSTADISWFGLNDRSLDEWQPIVHNAQLLNKPAGFHLITTGMERNAEEELELSPEAQQKIGELTTAQYKLQEICRIYERATDTDFVHFGKGKPTDFIAWALARGFDVEWLPWAISGGIVRKPNLATSSIDTKTAQPPQHEMNPKLEASYLTVMGALLAIVLPDSQDQTRRKPLANQSDLVCRILEQFPNHTYLKKRNLEQKFADARRQVRDD